jgi:hypothetical protein
MDGFAQTLRGETLAPPLFTRSIFNVTVSYLNNF